MNNLNKKNKSDFQKLEHRSYQFDVRAEEQEDGKTVITGRPIVYNCMTDIGWFDEIIERGALDKADLTDVRFLINHDTSKIPLARSRQNNENSTMHLNVVFDGLDIIVYLDTENNSDARSLYSAVQRGDITGMSFMFRVDDAEWQNLESDHPTRIIKSISVVVEVSAVTFPAYEDTSINARDSRNALDCARKDLENAKKRTAVSSENALELEKIKNENKTKGGI